MEKSTLGIAIFFAGLIAFLQSFTLQSTNQLVYLITGIALVVGGLWYASKDRK